METQFAQALLVTVLIRCVVENQIVAIAFLFREQMMESLEDLCAMKITVSWKFYFMLL